MENKVLNYRLLIDRLTNEVGIKVLNVENKTDIEVLDIVFFAVGVMYNRKFRDGRFEVSDSDNEVIIDVLNEWGNSYFAKLNQDVINEAQTEWKPLHCVPIDNRKWFAKWGEKVSPIIKNYINEFDPELYEEEYVSCSGRRLLYSVVRLKVENKFAHIVGVF